MAAPDFHFAINATFRHLHDVYGKEALIDYWRSLGREYYRPRTDQWKNGDLQTGLKWYWSMIGNFDAWAVYCGGRSQAVAPWLSK